MDNEFFNPLPTLTFAKWLDPDVLSSVLLYVILNTDSHEEALEVLQKIPLQPASKHFYLKGDDPPEAFRYFGVSLRYIPGYCYDVRTGDIAKARPRKKITSLIWDEFHHKVKNPELKEIYKDWVHFVAGGGIDDSDFSVSRDFMLLEQMAISLNDPAIKLNSNLAIGPSQLSAYLGGLVDKYLSQDPSVDDYRAVLLEAYGFVRKWVGEELDLRQLLAQNKCRQINDVIDVVAVNSLTMPLSRLRYLYKKYYRFRLRKYFFLVIKEQVKNQEQFLLYKCVPDDISTVTLYALKGWLMMEFNIPKNAFSTFDNYTSMKVSLYNLSVKPELMEVVDYIEGYSIRSIREQLLNPGEERDFYKTRKFLRYFFDFRSKHQAQPNFFAKTIDLLVVLMSKLRSEKDLDFLTDFVSRYVSRDWDVVDQPVDTPFPDAAPLTDVSVEEEEEEESNQDDDENDRAESGEYNQDRVDSDELNSVFGRPNKL